MRSSPFTSSTTHTSTEDQATEYSPFNPRPGPFSNTHDPQREYSDNSTLIDDAFDRGVDQMQASLYAAANAIGEATGFDSLAEWGMEGFQRNLQEILTNPPRIRDWDDVDSLADFGTYFIERLTEQAPDLLGDAAALAGGALVGAATGAGIGAIPGAAAAAGARKAALAQIGKALKRKVGEKGFANAAKKLSSRSAQLALTGKMVAQGIGETQSEFIERGIEEPGDAIIAGALKGAIDKFGFDRLMSLSKKTGKHPVSIIRGALKGAAVEGSTESIQTAVDLMAVEINDPDFELLSIDSLKQLREAAIVGGMVGGTAGAVVTAGEKVLGPKEPDYNQDTPTPESQETIDAQAEAMADPTSSKDTMQVTPGSPAPSEGKLPEGTTVVETPKGNIYTTNDAKVDDLVANDADNASTGRALYGEEEGKTGTDGTVVVAKNKDGVPVSEALTNADKLGETFQRAEELAPEGGSVEITDAESGLEDRARRIQDELEGPTTDLEFDEGELSQASGINVEEQTPVDRGVNHLRARLAKSRTSYINNAHDEVEELSVLYPLHEFKVKTINSPHGEPLAHRVQARPRTFSSSQEADQYAREIEKTYTNSAFTPEEIDGRWRLVEHSLPDQISGTSAVQSSDRSLKHRGRNVSHNERIAVAIAGAKRQATRIKRMSNKNGQEKKIIKMRDPGGKIVELSLPSLTTAGMDINKGDSQTIAQMEASAEGLTTALSSLMSLGYKFVDAKGIPVDAVFYSDANSEYTMRDLATTRNKVQRTKNTAEAIDKKLEATHSARDENFARLQKSATTKRDEWSDELDAIDSAQVVDRTAAIQKLKTAREKADNKLKAQGASPEATSGSSKTYADPREGVEEFDGREAEVGGGRYKPPVEENAEEKPRLRAEDTGESLTDGLTERKSPEFVKPSPEDYARFGIDVTKFRLLSEGQAIERPLSVEQARERVRTFLTRIDPSFDGVIFRGLRVDVVENAEQALGEGAPSNIMGAVTTDGRLVIVASNNDSRHSNPLSVEATLRHEVIAHIGLAQVVRPEDRTRLLNTIRGSHRQLQEGWNYVRAEYPNSSPTDQAEEVLAYYAERMPEKITAWGRVMELIRNMLRRVGFFARTMSQADVNTTLRDIHTAMKEHRTAEIPEAHTLAEVLRPGDVAVLKQKGAQIVNTIRRNPLKFPSMAVLTRDGQLRGISVALAEKIYRPTNTSPGERPAYWEAVDATSKEWASRLEHELKGYSTEEQQQAFNMLAMELKDEQLSPLAQSLRKLITQDFHKYLGDRMPLLKHRSIKNYFPRLYETNAIVNREDEFLEVLTRHGIEEPRTVLRHILSLQEFSGNKPSSFYAHITKIQQIRGLRDSDLIRDLTQRGFLNTNPAATLNSYLHSSVKRAELESLFGGYTPIDGYRSESHIAEWPEQAQVSQRTTNRRVITRIALKSPFTPGEFSDKQAKLYELEDEVFQLERTQSEPDREAVEALRAKKRELRDLIDSLEPEYQTLIDHLKSFGQLRETANGFELYDNSVELRSFIAADPEIREYLRKAARGLEGDAASKQLIVEKNRIHDLVMQSIETLPVDRDSKLYNAMGELRAFESLRVLLFSGIASIPETASVVARLKGVIPLKDIAGIVKDVTVHYKDHAEFARDIGAILQGTSITVQQELFGAGAETHRGFFRKMLPTFFKLNGNDALVKYITVFAVESGRQALMKSARDRTDFDLRFLRELGTTPEAVQTWVDLGGSKSIAEVIGTEYEADVRSAINALNRFVEEAMLRPKPSDRTSWSDHPIGGLFFHLKSFMYKFQRNVVQGGARELGNRYREKDTSALATTGWLLSTAGIFLFFAAVSDELRERFKSLGEHGSLHAAYGDPEKMLAKWVDRSGLTAVPWLDAFANPSVQTTAFTAGPVFSHLHMLLAEQRGDMEAVKKIVHSVPVLSQMPEFRKKVYEVIE